MLRNFVLAVAAFAASVNFYPAQQAGELPAAELLPLLAGYPKTLRQAILDMAAHPLLLAKLEKKDPNAPVEPIIAGAAPEVQQAARLLAKYPDVLKLLQSHAMATTEIGKQYKQDKKKVLDQLDEEAKAESDAADSWASLLGQNPNAVQQLKQALLAYQKQLGNNVTAADAANYAGVNVTANDVAVTALPTPGFINYTMANADAYPALANVMVGQWLGGRNSFAYDHAFNHWWSQYHNHFHHDLLRADADRGNRLGELARYDRRFAKDDRRLDKFGDHRKEFPHLGKIGGPAKDHKPEPNRKPPVKEPPHNREAGKGVRRAHPTEHQQAHHAAESHRGHAAHHGGRRR